MPTTRRFRWAGLPLAAAAIALATSAPVAAATTAPVSPLATAVLTPVLVSTSEQGLPGDGDSTRPSTSDDGSKVVFFSRSLNFVNSPPPLGGVYQKRGITRVPGRIRLASRAGSSRAGGPFLALDGGNSVLFAARGAMLPQDTNGTWDLYLSTFRGNVRLISQTAAGAAGNGASLDGVLAGGSVAFASEASDLVGGDTNGVSDVFVSASFGDPATVRVDVRPDGSQSTGVATRPSGSADGRFVSFLSTGTDLLPGLDVDAGKADAFVRDLQTGTTLWASASAPAGTQVLDATISPDGSRLVQRWQNGATGSVRITDLATGATTLVPGADSFSKRAFTADNRLLVYLSAAGAGTVRDLTLGITRSLSAKATGGAGNGIDGAPVITPSGRYAMFSSTSTNLVAADTLGVAQIYRVPIRVT
jgi:hypothetical protein